jgi:membrane protein DedA with SNARE-associated domain
VTDTSRLILICAWVVALPVSVLAADEPMVQSLMSQLETYGTNHTNRMVLLAGIALVTLISEDLACIWAGFLAARAIILPIEAIVASGLGIFVGDMLLYTTGYFIGAAALEHPPLKWFITPHAVSRFNRLFKRRGIIFIITCRFIPGTRAATFFAAGVIHYNVVKIVLIFAFAVAVWTPILVLGAMLAGHQALYYLEVYSAYALPILAGFTIGVYLLTRLVAPLFTWRGRRLLLGRWRRLSRWEFWPYYVTNVPTFIYVLYLGFIKYRKPALFTVVNPAMKPDGGFMWESKAEGLQALPADATGAWRSIPAGLSLEEKLTQVTELMADNRLSYPIVLKPDHGQRGLGVRICDDEEAVRDWLATSTAACVAMQYLPGEEFGVFYLRYPGAETGEIFSINRKKLIGVVGDGVHTLEELILLDDRAVCLAPLFLNRFTPELLDIIEVGETKQLVRIGTHSMGAVFLEGIDLKTDELLASVENIISHYKGFYFGRLDIRTTDEDSLRAGENLKIIEINGLTSEATSMYDPRYSIFSAWRILFTQWRKAFEIAYLNWRNGHQPMTGMAFIRHGFGWKSGEQST